MPHENHILRGRRGRGRREVGLPRGLAAQILAMPLSLSSEMRLEESRSAIAAYPSWRATKFGARATKRLRLRRLRDQVRRRAEMLAGVENNARVP